MPGLIAPAEVPVEMNAFKSQQHRWAKGSIQTCRKLLPRILRSNLPLGVKAEAFFHLTANFNYILMCVLSILMFPSMVIRYNMGWYEMILIDVPLFFAATFSFCNFYMVCQREIHTDWVARLKYVPFLMSVGIGLSINNTRAVFEALFNKKSEFTRTPKYRIEGDGDEWVGKKYRQSVAVQPLIELALGLYFTVTVFYALANGIYGTLPFLVLFQVGFLYTGLLSIVQQYAGSAVGLEPSRKLEVRSSDVKVAKSKVAVLRVTPDTILPDIDRLVDLAGVSDALAAGKTTILKDNISWHFPFPAANTTPWQLEGTIQALARRGFTDQVCVQNKTVVTNAFKGEDLNHYVPIFKHYEIPVLYNFKDDDMTWVRYEPKARMRVLDRIFPEGIHIPDYFFGKNIVHLPTTKCHIYTTTTGAMKNAFGGLLNTRRHYTHSWIHETLVDLLAIQKEIHSGLFAIMDGTTAGNGPGPRTMYPGGEERDAGVGRPGGDRRGVGEDDGLRSDVAPVHPARARGRPRRRRSAGDRDRRRRRCGAGELEVPRRQEPGARRRRRPDLVRSAQALPEAVLPHAARQRVHPGERRLPRLLPLAARRPPRVRALVRDDGVGADVPALRAVRAAGPADRRGGPAAGPHRAGFEPPSTRAGLGRAPRKYD